MLKFTAHFISVHLLTCVAKAVTPRRSRDINLSKFLKIQKNKTKWLASLTDSDQPAHWSMQTAKTLTKQCQYSGWSESRLFVHASATSSLSSKLGSLPTHYVTVLFCENTDQTIIKCRCNVRSSHHLTLNLFVSSADKLYKIFWSRNWSDILPGLIWIHTVWYSLEIDQTDAIHWM